MNIRQYIIINLRNRTAEVYTQPDVIVGTYASPLIVAQSETLMLPVGESEMFALKLSDVLP